MFSRVRIPDFAAACLGTFALACSAGCAKRPSTSVGAGPTPASASAPPDSSGAPSGTPPVLTVAPWPGPRGAFAFAEAESPAAPVPGWEVAESVGGRRDRSLASRGHVLWGAQPGKGEPTYPLSVTEAGEYVLWVRMGRPDKLRGEGNGIVVSVEQGAERGRWTFDPAPMVEKPGNDRNQFVWESQRVTLDAGDVRIKLGKAGRDHRRPEQRRVDCFLLTRDAAYAPDFRDFGVQLYARFTLLSAGRPVRFAHPLSNERVRRGAFSPPMSPGETTEFFNVSRNVSMGDENLFYLSVLPAVQRADYAIEFASAPRKDAIFHRTERHAAGTETVIVVPPSPSAAEPPRADFELAHERRTLAQQLPRFEFGRVPSRFPLLVDFSPDEQVRDDELQVLAYAGINGRSGLLEDRDVAAGLVTSRLYHSVYFVGPHGLIDADLNKARAKLEKAGKEAMASPHKDRIHQLKLIDEAQPWSLERLAADDAYQKGFTSWLREHRLDPKAPPAAVKLVTDRNYEYPGVYFYGQRYRASTIVDYFRALTPMVRRSYPPGAATTQNFSDGPVWQANLYTQGNDYFDYFSSGALEVATSEDWTNGGCTRELAGWNTALLRAATRERHQPVHMYVVAHSSRRPLEVKLRAMTHVSEGAKLLIFYAYNPRYSSRFEPGWAETPDLWPAIGEVSREIGAAEDVLLDAQPRPARTAILYSVPADIWEAGHDSFPGFDRMGFYIALRHAQIPVDILSDEQARGPALRGYDVAYLADAQLDARNVRALADWVKQGGTLVLGPGAGTRDEWNRPTGGLDAALGLGRTPLETRDVTVGSSQTVCREASSIGLVLPPTPSGEGSPPIEVLNVKQELSAARGLDPLATFEGGGIAAATLTRGKGRVVLLGFGAGVSYLCGAFRAYLSADRDELVAPLARVAATMVLAHEASGAPADVRGKRGLLNGGLPWRYSAPLRELIVKAAELAAVVRPVSADTPQVEVSLLEGAKGFAVPLANYSGRALARLVLELRVGRAHGKLRSAHQGELTVSAGPGGSERIELPLESTDIVFAAW